MKSSNHVKDKKTCYIYRKKSKDKGAHNKKNHEVRDHCHYTGKCSGAAHSV